MTPHARVLLALLLCAVPGTGRAQMQILLDANFQAQAPDQPIGFGGAAAGEPDWAYPNLELTVRDVPMATRSLEVAWLTPGPSVPLVAFDLLDGVEATEGQVVIELDLHPHVDGHFAVYLREAGGAAQGFGDLLLQPGGIVRIGDAAGMLLTPVNFEPGQTVRVRWRYDMTARTYDFEFGGQLLVDQRPIAPADEAIGIGTVLVGLGANTQLDNRISIDNLLVVQTSFQDEIFGDGFE